MRLCTPMYMPSETYKESLVFVDFLQAISTNGVCSHLWCRHAASEEMNLLGTIPAGPLLGISNMYIYIYVKKKNDKVQKDFQYIYTYKLGVHTTSYFSSEIKHAFEIPESVVSFQTSLVALWWLVHELQILHLTLVHVHLFDFGAHADCWFRFRAAGTLDEIAHKTQNPARTSHQANHHVENHCVKSNFSHGLPYMRNLSLGNAYQIDIAETFPSSVSHWWLGSLCII